MDKRKVRLYILIFHVLLSSALSSFVSCNKEEGRY